MKGSPLNGVRRRPFDALRAAMNRDISVSQITAGDVVDGPSLRVDPGRRERTGIPEVVLADGKSVETVRLALEALATRSGRAIASRCDEDLTEALCGSILGLFQLERHEAASAVILIHRDHPGAEIQLTGGRVGVITAGASDAGPAAEAALMAREMGCTVEEVRDVGVAGLHRLVTPLEALISAGADAIVIAAGMDGALPSVVAGLVDVPVIGLPTSIGYGHGGKGEAALLAMLQSCAAGLVVVNIDNGIGAGAAAARIANRAAEYRRM